MGAYQNNNFGKKNLQIPKVQNKTLTNNNLKNPTPSTSITNLQEENLYQEQCMIQGGDAQLFKIQDEKMLKTLLNRSIGALQFRKGKGPLRGGSGVIISKNIVLTAAHNVFNKKDKQPFSNLKFYLGANGITKNYYEVEDVRYMKEFQTCSDLKKLPFDFALLKLKRQVQYEQFLQLSLPCQVCLTKKNQQTEINVFGFPLSKYIYLDSKGQNFNLFQYGLARKNSIQKIDILHHKIEYKISTLPGQSGCPLVIGQQIIAIHNGSDITCKKFNIARLIDLPLFSSLEKWCKQLNGHSFQINIKDLCPHVQQTLITNKKIKQYQESNSSAQQQLFALQQLFKVKPDKLTSLLHRSIGALTFQNKYKKRGVGSGVLISKNMVLTSAHNLYDKEKRCEYQSFKFYLEDNGIGKHYYEAEAVQYPQEFKTCSIMEKMAFDFGLVKLKKDVDYKQFPQLALPCQTCLTNNKEISLRIFGYPMYEYNYRNLDEHGNQFRLSQYGLARKDSVAIFDASKHKISYGINTFPGQGGCPVAIEEQIIAIHNGTTKEGFGVARIFDIALFDQLKIWCKQQLKGDPFKISSFNCPHI